MGLRFVVVTAVARDDLPDGGAAHFAEHHPRPARPPARLPGRGAHPRPARELERARGGHRRRPRRAQPQHRDRAAPLLARAPGGALRAHAGAAGRAPPPPASPPRAASWSASGETLPEIARVLSDLAAVGLRPGHRRPVPAPLRAPTCPWRATTRRPNTPRSPRWDGTWASRTSRPARSCGPRSRPTAWPRRPSPPPDPGRPRGRRALKFAPRARYPARLWKPRRRRPRTAVDAPRRDGTAMKGYRTKKIAAPRREGHRDRLLLRAGGTATPRAVIQDVPRARRGGSTSVVRDGELGPPHLPRLRERSRLPHLRGRSAWATRGASSAAARTASGGTWASSATTRSSGSTTPSTTAPRTCCQPAQLRALEHGGGRGAPDRGDPARPHRADGLLEPPRATERHGRREDNRHRDAGDPAAGPRRRGPGPGAVPHGRRPLRRDLRAHRAGVRGARSRARGVTGRLPARGGRRARVPEGPPARARVGAHRRARRHHPRPRHPEPPHARLQRRVAALLPVAGRLRGELSRRPAQRAGAGHRRGRRGHRHGRARDPVAGRRERERPRAGLHAHGARHPGPAPSRGRASWPRSIAGAGGPRHRAPQPARVRRAAREGPRLGAARSHGPLAADRGRGPVQGRQRPAGAPRGRRAPCGASPSRCAPPPATPTRSRASEATSSRC